MENVSTVMLMVQASMITKQESMLALGVMVQDVLNVRSSYESRT